MGESSQDSRVSGGKNQGRCSGFWKAGPTGGATSLSPLETLARLVARATAEENADKSEGREGISKA